LNNGDNIPNGDLVQKLRCNICFPHVVLVLIEKKRGAGGGGGGKNYSKKYFLKNFTKKTSKNKIFEVFF